ncbi:MAG: ABC transporter ATP-binding protein [Sarcina sp.]
MNAIEIRNLKKTFGDFKLDIKELNIPKGYITGFIGKNGSGKTTTIKLIMGLLFPEAGEIKIFDKKLIDHEIELKSKIGYIGVESGYPDYLELKKIKKMISRFYKSWDDSLYDKYIEKFNLNQKKLYKELSSGQKKQFDLCMTLSHKPKLLIMDEPTTNLDPVIRNEFLEILSEHLVNDDMSVFYSSHITSDLEKSADYVNFIDNGKIFLSGVKDELLDKHKLIKAPKELLDENIKKYLMGINEYEFGFKALTTNYAEVHDILGDEAVYDNVSLEDLIIYYSKR